MLNKYFKIDIVLLFILIIQAFVSPEIFTIIILGLDFIYILKFRRIFTTSIIPGIFTFIIFIIHGTLIGIGNISSYKSIDIIRDIYYVVNSLSILYLGMCLSKNKNNIQYKYNSLYIAAAILGILTLYDFFMISGNISDAININFLRREYNASYVYSCTLCAYLFLFNKKNKYSLNRAISLLCFLISLLSIVISLSRTNIFIFFVLVITTLIYYYPKKFFKRIFMLFLIFIPFLIMFTFIFPDNLISDFLLKFTSSLTEINTNNDWKSPSVIQENWRGYENFCAIQEIKNGSILNFFFGFGYGKRVYVDYYASSILGHFDNGLPTNTIAVLHNGYFTMMIKNGLIGLFIYIIFFINLLKKSKNLVNKHKNNFNYVFLFGLVISMMFITYFFNGFFKDTYILSVIVMVPILFNYKVVEKEKEGL